MVCQLKILVIFVECFSWSGISLVRFRFFIVVLFGFSFFYIGFVLGLELINLLVNFD